MPYVTVYDYPNASTMYNKYDQIETNLISYRTAISTVVNKTLPTVTVAQGARHGDYYDEFDLHASDWLTEATNIQADFTTFRDELNNIIAQVNSAATLWRTLSTQTHQEWHDEP